MTTSTPTIEAARELVAVELGQWEDDGGAISPEREDAIQAGDQVREAAWRVPPGCQPFVARVLDVAPDGWVSVKLGPRSFSFSPDEVEKVA